MNKATSAAASAPQAVQRIPDDAVVVGRVSGSYGVRGMLRVEPFNDPHESVLLQARRWYVRRPSPSAPGQGVAQASLPFALPALLAIERCRVHGASLVASVAGIGVKELADALRGCELSVSRSDFPAPDEGEYYWVDLVGCAVFTPQGAALGIVEAVDDHGAHPLLHVRDADQRERLIPFVSAHVSEVDLAGRRIVADWDPDF